MSLREGGDAVRACGRLIHRVRIDRPLLLFAVLNIDIDDGW